MHAAMSPLLSNRLNSLRRLPALAALLLAASFGSAWSIEPGQPVPDLELHGSSVGPRMSDLKGKLVYVDFWASWCGPCKQSFPWMSEMQRKYGARGLQIVAINLDAKRSDADTFLAQAAPGFALAFDSKGVSARLLGVKAMPTSVLVGPDGKVLYVHQGFRPEEKADLEARLVAALGAK